MPANRPTRPPQGYAPIVAACAVALAIVVVLALVALPGGENATPSPTATTAAVLAAAKLAPTDIPSQPPTAPPAPTKATRQINLDLGPLVTDTPTIARRTATTSPAPTRTLGPPVPSEQELVANGGFETSDGSWYVEQGAGLASGDAHSGAGALAIGPGGGYADQRVPVHAGATYQVTIWTRLTAPGDSGQIGVRYEDAAFAAITTITPILQDVGGADWTETTFTFTAPPGAARVVLSFWHPLGAGTLLVDDVSVRELVPS